MKDVFITPDGAKVLRAMIVSCGSSGCFDAIRALETLEGDIRISEVGADKDGNWKMAVFQRLGWFASEEGLEKLGSFEIARYFGGRLHIDIMSRLSGQAGLGRYLGKDVGLVSHILLPLTDGKYKNEGREISFGKMVQIPAEKETPLFYHLGLIAGIPLSTAQISQIKEEQAAHPLFMESLSKIKEPINPPGEYFEALNCSLKKSGI